MSGLDLFRRLLDDSGDPIFCFDLDCRYLAGDLLLNGVAKRLIECVRETETTARVGGDEFVGRYPDFCVMRPGIFTLSVN